MFRTTNLTQHAQAANPEPTPNPVRTARPERSHVSHRRGAPRYKRAACSARRLHFVLHEHFAVQAAQRAAELGQRSAHEARLGDAPAEGNNVAGVKLKSQRTCAETPVRLVHKRH